MRLQGKVSLITGAASGIGRAIAERFAAEGSRVALLDRNKESLAQTANGIRAKGSEALELPCDVQDAVEVRRNVERVLERWQVIHVAVAAAGICAPSPFLDIREKEWDRHFGINLKGAFLVSQDVARAMASAGTGGSIVHISSVNGLAAEAEQAHYNATKGGLNLLAKSMALELADLGIRVNAVCPGYIETPLSKSLMNNPSALREMLHSIPMGRVGQPEEVALAALFLASDESRYVTGHCLVVDGGQTIKLS